jgi:hyperosmotically inducible protein
MKLIAFGSLAALLLAASAPAFADKSAGESVDDGTITTEVKAGLVGAKGVSSNDINIETYKSVVLLSGFVTDQAQKDTADKVAKGVKGVKKVENKLIVHASTSMGTKLDDTALVATVKAALVDADKVKSTQINIEARDGIVQLGGFVQSEGMKQRAMDITKGVKGVKRVEDALLVKPK